MIKEELRPIFISIAYHYYSRVNIDTLKSIDIIEKSLDLKLNTINKLYLMNIYYMRNNDHVTLVKLAKQGINICKSNNNKYFLVRFYNSLAYVYRFTNPQKAIHYLTLCITNFSKQYDLYSTLFAFYHNMAHLCYDQKKYSTILYMYKKHLYNDVQFLTVFFYLLIYIYNKTTEDNIEIQRIISIVEPKIKNSPFDKVILNLFKTKYLDDTDKTLDNINDIIKFKEYFLNEPIMKEIIIETIKECCINVNNYNLYKYFIENFQ